MCKQLIIGSIITDISYANIYIYYIYMLMKLYRVSFLSTFAMMLWHNAHMLSNLSYDVAPQHDSNIKLTK